MEKPLSKAGSAPTYNPDQTLADQAIFDTFRLNITNGVRKVLVLSYHFARMQAAINARRVSGPTELKELTDQIRTASSSLGDGHYRVRVTLPPDAKTNRTATSGRCSTLNWSLAIFPWTSYQPQQSGNQSYGIKVLPIQGAVRADPLFKTWGARSISMQARQKAISAGYDEALLIGKNDEILEGDWSNFFALSNGELITPPLSSGLLPGVTRKLIMKIAPAKEKIISLSDLPSATEAFFTRATDHILPISRIGNLYLPPPPKPGVVSTLLDQLSEYYEII